MNDPDDRLDGPDPQTLGISRAAPPSQSANVLAAILDQYMADLQAGKRTRSDGNCSRRILRWHRSSKLAWQGSTSSTAPPACRRQSRPPWASFASCARSAGAAWASSMKPTKPRSNAGSPLKVLRFGVVADQEAMQRFRREAETVARLHHTNIVPIFAVGSDRGVHYYAMQYHRRQKPRAWCWPRCSKRVSFPHRRTWCAGACRPPRHSRIPTSAA